MACSSGHLEEDVAEPELAAGDAAPSGATPSDLAAPRAASQGTGLTISGDAELLTNLVFPDGSEVAFIRIGDGFLTSELVDSSAVARTKALSAELTPVERFEQLAPELEVPQRLLDTQLRLGWNDIRPSETRTIRNDPVVPQAPGETTLDPELSNPDEALDGLQDFSNCDAETFVDDACDGLSAHDFHWQQTNQDDNSNKNRSGVWRGETNVCAKTGQMYVRLVVEDTDIFIIRELTAGKSDLRHWQTLDCHDPPWYCWPLCDPYCFWDGRDIVHTVYQVLGADRFHWCGSYDFE